MATPDGLLTQMASWGLRRWLTVAVTAAATVVIVAIPTDMIPNAFFTRSMPVTWWSWPALIVSAVLSGLLVATYVAVPENAFPKREGSGRFGTIGVFATYFAVGCPVCNKLVVLALGVSGAMAWFAPVQPILAAASIVLLVIALRARLKGLASCRLPERFSADEAAVGTEPSR